MHVKFTDIYVTQGQATSARYIKKSGTVPIAKAVNINFESIFSIEDNIESRMLHCLGQEVVGGNHILFAKPAERQCNGNLLYETANHERIAIDDLIRISPQFLYYYLYLNKHQITVNTKNGQRISNEKLFKLTVPIPNLATQKNIIVSVKKKIERAESLTKKIQKEIANLKEENNKAILQVFSTISHFITNGKLPAADTKIVTIKEAGYVQAGKTPNGSIASYFGNEYPFYNQTAFAQGMDISIGCRHLSARGIKEAKLFSENSVLVCHIGAQFGKAGIARKSGACNSQILSVSVFENVLPEYLYYQIISESFQQQMKQFSTKLSISKADFENLYIELPALKKQEEIISFFKENNNCFRRNLQKLSDQLYKTEAGQHEIFTDLFSEQST